MLTRSMTVAAAATALVIGGCSEVATAPRPGALRRAECLTADCDPSPLNGPTDPGVTIGVPGGPTGWSDVKDARTVAAFGKDDFHGKAMFNYTYANSVEQTLTLTIFKDLQAISSKTFKNNQSIGALPVSGFYETPGAMPAPANQCGYTGVGDGQHTASYSLPDVGNVWAKSVYSSSGKIKGDCYTSSTGTDYAVAGGGAADPGNPAAPSNRYCLYMLTYDVSNGQITDSWLMTGPSNCSPTWPFI